MPPYCRKALDNTQSIVCGLFVVCRHVCSAKTASHLWARNFSELLAADDADGLAPVKEDKGKSAKKGRPQAYFPLSSNAIIANGIAAGAIRIVDKHEYDAAKRISPVFVMPEYRNRGLAQMAIKLAEEKHGCSGWELETILEEKGNCHLYERMGYRQTGALKPINEKMTLVFYKKD